MELKFVLSILRKHLCFIIIFCGICTAAFLTAGIVLVTPQATSSQENVPQPQIIPREAYVFVASSTLEIVPDASVDSKLTASVIKGITEPVQNQCLSRYIATKISEELNKEYGINYSTNYIRSNLACRITANSLYVVLEVSALTIDDAIQFANASATVACREIPSRVSGVSTIKQVDVAKNDYSQEEIAYLEQQSKKAIEDNSVQQVGITRRDMIQRIMVISVLGLILGAAMSVCFAFLREYLSPYFSSSESLPNVLDTKVLAKFGKTDSHKAAVQLYLAIKPNLPCVVSFVSIDEKINISTIIKEFVASYEDSRVMVVSSEKLILDDSIQTQTVSADKLLKSVKEYKNNENYDIIIADGGSLNTDYQAWELFTLDSPVIGIVDKKTRISNAHSVGCQLDGVGHKLFGVIWIDGSAKNKK